MFPLSLIYGLIVYLRNLLFDKQVFKSNEFDVKTILVGNLSAGGTGKTPHIEYLIRLLKSENKIATLSRGYGRKTHGFLTASKTSTASEIGDEPLQFSTKFSDISVHVGVKRVDAVIEIMSEENPPEVILLDDAFQHRAIKAGLNILLTDYSSPFYKDYMLPTGYLREFPKGKKRAEIIIVTKCPVDISEEKKEEIQSKIKPNSSQELYFSRIKYGNISPLFSHNKSIKISDLKNVNVLLLTGIANPNPLMNYLKTNRVSPKHLKFTDHHNFTKKDIQKIIFTFENIQGSDNIILTTEKDAMRLKSISELKHLPIYFQEIEIEIIGNQEKFNNRINQYIKK